jgi:hypothetical protein
VSAYWSYRIPRVTVNRSTRAEGPFISQIFSDFLDGDDCFMQICSGVVVGGPIFKASIMMIYLSRLVDSAISFRLNFQNTTPLHNIVKLAVELFQPS